MGGDYFSALGLGLAGAGHCLGMCGGIVSLFNISNANNRSSFAAIGHNTVFQLGRISCYMALGALAGYAGSLTLKSNAQFIGVLHWLSLLLLIGIALSILDWWNPYKLLEKAGGKLWQRVQPLGSALLPVNRKSKAYALGIVWGFLPCGLIYSTLAWATTSGSASSAALLMFFFGLGTMPALLGIGSFAGELKQQLQRTAAKYMLAFFLIGVGLLPFYAHQQHGNHSTNSLLPAAAVDAGNSERGVQRNPTHKHH
ncbi:MAG: sulfite exporter TauE/SafE family protein [Pseudomonadales bacterium]|nr:sulfite exporter TauE/SafE family protein [Pseudomonadales bacterium]